MYQLTKLLGTVAFFSLLFGCESRGYEPSDRSDSSEWTNEELENFQHFLRSQNADIEAVRLLNSTPEADVFHVLELLALRKEALAEARLVEDEILDKALPGMSGPFRLLYVRSLELKIRNLEIGDVEAEIRASSLHDEWVDWFNAHKSAMRVPRISVGE